MTIPSFKILKKNASERVAASENAGRVVLVYAAAVAALSALVFICNYVLDLRIAQTGGLSNMGLRSVLSTFQSVLPMVQSFVIMCLEIGYIAAMLRVSRQQYVSEKTLKLGFDRFWVLLRYTLIQSGIFMLAGIAAFWIAMQIYIITPLSDAAVELLTPLVSGTSALSEAAIMDLLQDEALGNQLIASMTPMFVLFGVLYTALCVPILYSLRMTQYVIIDKPAAGAMHAMRESRMMMRGSRMRLFKLDLSLWWWYAITAATVVLCYGDVILSLLGIALPWSDTVSYFLFYVLFLVAQLVSCYFLRNRVEVVYAQVYNALKPREQTDGVVLGNIFQM